MAKRIKKAAVAKILPFPGMAGIAGIADVLPEVTPVDMPMVTGVFNNENEGGDHE